MPCQAPRGSATEYAVEWSGLGESNPSWILGRNLPAPLGQVRMKRDPLAARHRWRKTGASRPSPGRRRNEVGNKTPHSPLLHGGPVLASKLLKSGSICCCDTSPVDAVCES